MNTANFRFYGSLNDFLPPERRQAAFPYSFNADQSIKHLLEALGVPHTEVDLILVNGKSVSFSYLAQQGDRISVYPRFERIDITTLTRVRPHPLLAARLILDNHLGKLATYLRMLGFDALYQNDFKDEELATLSIEQERILLKRIPRMLKGNPDYDQIERSPCLEVSAPVFSNRTGYIPLQKAAARSFAIDPSHHFRCK